MPDPHDPGASAGFSPVWHPFTQHAIAGPMVLVERGEGAYLYTPDGRAILDAISSWWVNTHGHGHPRIAAAIAEQAGRLEQVIFAGFTHPPAEALARKLLALTPEPLEFAFFSDSGSTAVEVAIKMAVGRWHHAGKPRVRVAVLEHGYHGDTFGTMSVGERDVFFEPYGKLLFHVDRLPFPQAGREQHTLDSFEALLKASAAEIAALVIEPLVLGAGGMLMYPPWVLKGLAELCRRHDVLLIADEVMTGFGRTGSVFACDRAEVIPDIMCLSKGITGGFLPMGVTLATWEIYDAFYAEDRRRTFYHSSSYTGNPIACAAALACMEIWQTEPVMERIERIANHHARRLPGFAGRGEVASVRQTGTIAAIEMRVPEAGYLADLGPRLYRFYMQRNILLRPLGNLVYVLPPYCTTEKDLDRIYDVIEESLDLVGN